MCTKLNLREDRSIFRHYLEWSYLLTYLLTYTYKLRNFERPHGLKDPSISSSLVGYPPSVMNVC